MNMNNWETQTQCFTITILILIIIIIKTTGTGETTKTEKSVQRGRRIKLTAPLAPEHHEKKKRQKVRRNILVKEALKRRMKLKLALTEIFRKLRNPCSLRLKGWDLTKRFSSELTSLLSSHLPIACCYSHKANQPPDHSSAGVLTPSDSNSLLLHKTNPLSSRQSVVFQESRDGQTPWSRGKPEWCIPATWAHWLTWGLRAW